MTFTRECDGICHEVIDVRKQQKTNNLSDRESCAGEDVTEFRVWEEYNNRFMNM